MVGNGHELLEEFHYASPDALVVVDGDGVILAANKAVEGMFGYRPDELIGERVEILVPSRSRERHVGFRTGYVSQPEVRPMGAGLDLLGCRRDGSEFPVDVSLVPSAPGAPLRVGAFVRDTTVRRRSEDLLRLINEISRHALAGGDISDLLELSATRALVLTDAVTAWIAVPDGPDRVVVAAAAGKGAAQLRNAILPLRGSLSGRVLSGEGTLVVEDLARHPDVMQEAREVGLGPGVYLPMSAEEGPVGTLVIARNATRPNFDQGDIRLAEIYSSAIGVVLALGSARQALEEVRVSAEHERIGRDLHDTVIQRLFAIGMGLQASERLLDGPAAERIRESVSSLDEVIREIRETIFDLSHPDSDHSSIRHQLRGVASEAAVHLGFSPRVDFRGPVESVIGPELAGQIVPVLREALANVGRHARASRVDVVLHVGEGSITLSVTDDGVGMGDEPSAGRGTTNMGARAEALAGEFALRPRQPSGTVLRWRIPIPE